MIEIKYLKAFKDNYIWLIQAKDEVIVIDPGQSQQIIDYIIKNKLKLNSIFLTHSHTDHVGGVADLLNNFGIVKIYGAAENSYSNVHVSDSEKLQILPEITIEVYTTPGHTMDGVSFLVNKKHLFCGDTLFAGGCGRVFTGEYALMYSSLGKIKNLYNSINDILIYSAHEYTLNNLLFAKIAEPKNIDIKKRIKEVEQIRSNDGITLPTKLDLELNTNPFLRCDITYSEFGCLSELERFTQLRKMKDIF